MNNEGWNPGKLLEVSGAYWQTCALHAGVKLDLFTELGGLSLNADQLAQSKDLDPRALSMLLDALVAMGLLTKSGDRYANTPASLAFLSKESDEYVGHMILHHHHLVESWSRLDESVKSGKPVRTRASFSDGERRESFLMGMYNNAMLLAPQLVPQVDLSGRRHLLDMGGGPGTYAIHFCRHNPGLTATVFDLPTTRPFAEKTIASFRLEDRIDFQPGSYLKDPVPGTYDAAWLSHILHGEGPRACRMIIEKAAAALTPGGLILIHEFILDDVRDRPLFPALFSLNMLLGTESGKAYSEGEIRNMLEDAGIGDIQRHPFRGPTDSGIIFGTR
ncbi:MAG: SAM-dependent methyltransferase [Desulfobacterales bacterium]|nr:SAM-dependent methyltransferase [Desulfobacterales bacterium]